MSGESARRIEADVVVSGGGPAGFGAAMAAAREGARVILVEKAEFLGGMMTGGLVVAFHGMRVHRGRHTVNVYQYVNYYEKQVIRGVAQELVDRVLDLHGTWGEKKGEAASCVLFDPELVKHTLEQMCLEAGVRVWLQSLATRPILEGDRVAALEVENKSGRHVLEAGAFVDATGDGDVAARSGVPFSLGEGQKDLQPVSLVFIMGGVNLSRTLDYLKANPAELQSGTYEKWRELYDQNMPVLLIGFGDRIAEAHGRGDYPLAIGAQNPIPFFAISSMYRWGRAIQHETHQCVDMGYHVDTTCGEEVTAALIGTRTQAIRLARFMRNYIPGYEDAYLLETAPQLGIRESRRMSGLYQLTQDDVLNGRDFEDSIARCGRAMNVHSSHGGQDGERHGGRKWTEIKEGRSYGVPYRCLLPSEGPSNLVFSGRCIATDRIAFGSVRGQPLCMALGQAAGVAAAIGAKEAVPLAALDIGRLRSALSAQDVIL